MPSNEDILKALSLDPNQAQPQSRSDLLYGLVPDYLKFQEPSPMPPPGATPGKIGPPSGMPTALDVAGKALPDALSWLAPGAGKVAGAAGKAIVPFSVASKLPRTLFKEAGNSFPSGSSFEQAVANSGGELTPQGLMLDLLRYQSPRRAGKDALSGGVFYMTPKSDPRMSEIYNANTNKKMPWGGTQEISGKTLFKNPYITKAGWGGPAVFDVAGPDLLGQVENHMLGRDISRATSDEARKEFFKQWAPEVTPPPPGASKNWQRMWPWLSEAAIGSKARQLGYDSIIAHGMQSTDMGEIPQTKPTINEIFDLRESHYPTPEGGYKLWPQFQQHLLEALKK